MHTPEASMIWQRRAGHRVAASRAGHRAYAHVSGAPGQAYPKSRRELRLRPGIMRMMLIAFASAAGHAAALRVRRFVRCTRISPCAVWILPLPISVVLAAARTAGRAIAVDAVSRHVTGPAGGPGASCSARCRLGGPDGCPAGCASFGPFRLLARELPDRRRSSCDWQAERAVDELSRQFSLVVEETTADALRSVSHAGTRIEPRA